MVQKYLCIALLYEWKIWLWRELEVRNFCITIIKIIFWQMKMKSLRQDLFSFLTHSIFWNKLISEYFFYDELEIFTMRYTRGSLVSAVLLDILCDLSVCRFKFFCSKGTIFCVNIDWPLTILPVSQFYWINELNS